MEGSVIRFRPQPLRIGSVLVEPPLILAPMAGVTDGIYRYLMAEHGAGMVTTEMVSVQGVVRDQPATWDLCAQDIPLGVPLAVQIFGGEPQTMAEAARRVEGRGASIIDINAGCPVKKVVRQGAGAVLLKTPDLLARIVEEVKRAVRVPVTVKVRLGWDSQSRNVVEVVRRLESAGVDAVAIHGRTAVQHYGGEADWSWIRRVKDAVRVPIIGNGDITNPVLADAMLQQTGCDAVMIGRATQGNPWLLAAIVSRWGYPAWSGGRDPDWTDFARTVHTHVQGFRERRPHGAGHFRKLLLWYSRGCPDSSRLRAQLGAVDEPDRMLEAFSAWIQDVMARGVPFLPVKVPERVCVI